MYEKTQEAFSTLPCQGSNGPFQFCPRTSLTLGIGQPNQEDKVELPLILASEVLVLSGMVTLACTFADKSGLQQKRRIWHEKNHLLKEARMFLLFTPTGPSLSLKVLV